MNILLLDFLLISMTVYNISVFTTHSLEILTFVSPHLIQIYGVRNPVVTRFRQATSKPGPGIPEAGQATTA